MQRRLVLDVDSVNVDLPDVDQELDQLRTLDGIDEAGSTKMIGTVYIGPGSHKALDDVLKRDMKCIGRPQSTFKENKDRTGPRSAAIFKPEVHPPVVNKLSVQQDEQQLK